MTRVILAGAVIVVGALVAVAAKSDEVAVVKPKAIERPVLSFEDEAVVGKLVAIWTEYESQIAGQNAKIEEELKRLRALAQKKGDIEELKLWDAREKQWRTTAELNVEPKAQNDTFAEFLRERTLKYGKASETLEKEYKALVAKVLKGGNVAWAKELDEAFRAIEPVLPPRPDSPPRRRILGLPDGHYRSDYTNGWSQELIVEGDSVAVVQSGFNGRLQPPHGPTGGVFKNISDNAYMINIGPFHEVWFISRNAGGRDIKVQHWASGADRLGPPTDEGAANRVTK